MQKFITGIDIGTHQVKVVIAEVPNDPRELPRIIGTGYAESRGMKQGYLISAREVTRSVVAAVAEASKAANVKVKSAYLALGGIGLEEAFARGEVVVERGNSEISERDIARATKAATDNLPASALVNRKIIHTIPLRYLVDGVPVLGKNPLGMRGARLGVEALFITCLKSHMEDLESAVEDAKIEVDDVVAAPFAASFAALNRKQRQLGCVLANIGAETFSIIVLEDDAPVSIKVFPTGGIDITNDLALALRIDPEEAEKIKRGADCEPALRRKSDDVISARFANLLKLLDAHLKKIGKDELLPAGIILTGGSAAIPNSHVIARNTLRIPARFGELEQASAMRIKDAAWAVAYGLTIWGGNQGMDIEYNPNERVGDFAKSFWGKFKKFLP